MILYNVISMHSIKVNGVKWLKKAVIFYFSGTGNTWWVAKTLAGELRLRGVEIQSFSIEQVSITAADRLIADYEAVGFAYPVYGSDLPKVMKDFISGLAPVNGRTAFVFCTQWMWSGDGARVGAEMLQNRGFAIKWAEHFCMPNNICVTVTSFLPYTNDQRKLARRLAKTAVKIKRFAGQLAQGKPFLRGFSRIGQLSGNIQRVPFRKMFERLRDDIGIDTGRCNYCGACVHLCPSGNLVLEGRDFITKGTCILCVRCYSFCPQTAITYMRKTHNLKRGKPYRGPVEEFHPRLIQ